MKKLTRRGFLSGAGKMAVAGGVVLPQILPSRLLGKSGVVSPSGKINMAIIGNGLQAKGHRRSFASNPNTQVLSVCDVYDKHLFAARDEVDEIAKKRNDIGFKKCKAFKDYQETINDDEIDAVCIVTPDHWHVAIALYAIQQGKAVYLEKPMSLTIEEGRILSDAVKKYDGILQVGSQQRSEWAFRKAAELVRNGYIGKVNKIVTKIWEFPPIPTNLKEEAIPEGLDYDKWLGPTPWYPYNFKRVEGNYGGGWRCFFEYGDRKEGDWGAHHFDIIQWALGMDHSGPTDFYPPGANGSKERHYVYENGTTVYVNGPTKNNHMIHFIGDEGEIMVSRDAKFEASDPRILNMPLKSNDTRLLVSGGHHGNLLNAIKYGQELVADVEVGHRTSTICHLSSAALRLGKHIKWDPKNEKILNCPEAEPIAFSRPRRAPYFLGV